MAQKKHECPEMMDLIVDYLEEELDDEERRHLEFHLELCPPCMNFLQTYKQTGTVCREALERQMPSALKSSLHDFLSHACCGSKKK